MLTGGSFRVPPATRPRPVAALDLQPDALVSAQVGFIRWRVAATERDLLQRGRLPLGRPNEPGWDQTCRPDLQPNALARGGSRRVQGVARLPRAIHPNWPAATLRQVRRTWLGIRRTRCLPGAEPGRAERTSLRSANQRGASRGGSAELRPTNRPLLPHRQPVVRRLLLRPGQSLRWPQR